METVAVYWESKIKTYGFERISELALIELSCSLPSVKSLAEMLTGDEMQGLNPSFIMAQESEGALSFVFCMTEKQGMQFYAALEQRPSSFSCRYIYPVGIIFFYGPHFGDRYGIADAAFSAVSKEGIQLIASGCVSSSVYLIMAQDDLSEAEQELRKTFEAAT
ncbi:MAG: hypothetical protein ACOC6E_02740 [Thermodesulfobacteriota bacterium]